jgi:hypothetical protein
MAQSGNSLAHMVNKDLRGRRTLRAHVAAPSCAMPTKDPSMPSSLKSLLTALALALVCSAPASAQRKPSKPIRIVVPFTPGTGIDVIARAIAPMLQERLGQAVIVDNKPGASGTIGFGFVAKSAPDGHTLLLTANGFVISPSLIKNVPYDPVRSFAPIALTASGALDTWAGDVGLARRRAWWQMVLLQLVAAYDSTFSCSHTLMRD